MCQCNTLLVCDHIFFNITNLLYSSFYMQSHVWSKADIDIYVVLFFFFVSFFDTLAYEYNYEDIQSVHTLNGRMHIFLHMFSGSEVCVIVSLKHFKLGLIDI